MSLKIGAKDQDKLHRLTAMLGLEFEGATWALGTTDEGSGYISIASPNGALSYFIKPLGAGWTAQAEPDGVPIMGPTLGAVLLQTALALLQYWADLLEAGETIWRGDRTLRVASEGGATHGSLQAAE